MENAGFEPSLGGAEGAELPLPAGAVGLLVGEVVVVEVPVVVAPDVPVETGVAGTVVFEPGGVVPSFATTEKTPLVLVFAVPASVNVKKYLPALTSTVHGNAFGVKLTAALMSLGVFEALSVIIN